MCVVCCSPPPPVCLARVTRVIIATIGRVANFLAFLKYGRYPSLLQRLTGMRLAYHDALVRLPDHPV